MDPGQSLVHGTGRAGDHGLGTAVQLKTKTYIIYLGLYVPVVGLNLGQELGCMSEIEEWTVVTIPGRKILGSNPNAHIVHLGFLNRIKLQIIWGDFGMYLKVALDTNFQP